MPKDEKKKLPKGIYKRGGVFWVRYVGVDGRMIFESAKRGDRSGTKVQDAEALLHERKADVGKGKQPEVKRIAAYTFKDLADQYGEWMKGRHRSEHVKRYIITHLTERFGNIPLRRFNTPIVEELQTDLINKGHKNAYTNKILNVFGAMFTKAVEWEMVEDDTLRKVRKVKALQENKRLRYLSIEECQRLIDACESYLKPIVIIALNTGMRRGEILSLKRENLDLINGFILLDRTKNGERREVPLDDNVMEALRATPRRLDTPYVFAHPTTGKPYSTVKYCFAAACRAVGLTDFHFHDLRHTFASHLVMAGQDLTTVKELMGHKDIKMTLRYAHLAPAHKRKAVNVLNDLYNADCTKTRQ